MRSVRTVGLDCSKGGQGNISKFFGTMGKNLGIRDLHVSDNSKTFLLQFFFRNFGKNSKPRFKILKN